MMVWVHVTVLPTGSTLRLAEKVADGCTVQEHAERPTRAFMQRLKQEGRGGYARERGEQRGWEHRIEKYGERGFCGLRRVLFSMCESFFGTLECELILRVLFSSLQQARLAAWNCLLSYDDGSGVMNALGLRPRGPATRAPSSGTTLPRP